MGKSFNLWSNPVCCLEKSYMNKAVLTCRIGCKGVVELCSSVSDLPTLPFVDTKVLPVTLGDDSSCNCQLILHFPQIQTDFSAQTNS